MLHLVALKSVLVLNTGALKLVVLTVGITCIGWTLLARQRKLPAIIVLWAGLIVAAGIAFDLLLLVTLPRLGVSYAPVFSALSFMLVLRLGTIGIALVTAMLAGVLLRGKPASISGSLAPLWFIGVATVVIEVYAMFVEPFALQTTRIHLEGPQVASGRPLRILHLTDIHVERITRREQNLLEQVNALQPDLILMTGDYLNQNYLYDARTHQDARWLFSNLSAPLGVYAVSGTLDHPELLRDVVDGLNVRLLTDEMQRVEVGGQDVYLLGVSNLGRDRDMAVMEQLASQVPGGAYSILLYHNPDLAYEAAQAGVDLYLAGHTHGGQLRLPGYGAVITGSIYGKRFESGLFDVAGMRLFVSRGIGLEGLGLPRARFLCLPEITLFELGAGAGQ
jgi:uncharacterized protein